MILAGGKYLEIKASLHLYHESIQFLGKDENQVFSTTSKRKRKYLQFNNTIIRIFLLLHITQINKVV